MRIPLDYYRILSVPVKANLEQLEQAYGDRLLQQPRREYSESAVEARQKLIEYSYQVLSDAEQRAVYDTQFLINMQLQSTEPETESGSSDDVVPEPAAEVATISQANPTIEIAAGQLVGALIILHELGEYETVLELGIDYFNQRESELGADTEVSEISLDTTQEDLILTLALAYLEFSREQWHRQEYEKAALSGQMGVDLLQQKSLFPQIQSELERDLYRLRPYRILELISQHPAKSLQRAEGFTLLQSMLLQREGIEGKGEDRSGLNFDQFLCFVQQLRSYLTSAEQQQLFDNAGQSNSAIASYLAVYALLGRGFCLKQPELVLRAQRKLDTLSVKQDVNWEQAVTALLLGHTEKAVSKLHHAADPTRLQQIELHSQSSTDLLPGLCFYGEQWLQDEVISQFSDLSGDLLTLKEYFADPQVQSYLEELTANTLVAEHANGKSARQNSASESSAQGGIMSLWRSFFPKQQSTSVRPARASATVNSAELVGASSEVYEGKMPSASSTSTVTLERNAASEAPQPNRHFAPRGNRPPSKKSLSLPLQPKTTAVPESVMRKVREKPTGKVKHRRKKRSKATLWKGWLFIIGLIFGVGTISHLAMKLFLSPERQPGNQLAIALSEPAIEIPTQEVKPPVTKPKPTFTQQSQQVIQTWLDSKSAAFGKEHQISQLEQILAEPLLTIWRDIAQLATRQRISTVNINIKSKCNRRRSTQTMRIRQL